MAGEIDFDGSVDARTCCFCGEPPVYVPEKTDKQRLTVNTTEGEAVVLHYHEACFQEWLGHREHIASASPLLKAQFIR